MFGCRRGSECAGSAGAKSLDGDAFGEVAGLIDITSEGYGGVVAEELEGDDVEDGLEHVYGLGDVDDVVGVVMDLFIAFCGDGDDGSAAGFDLLHGADVLFVEAVLGADADGGGLGIYEGDDAVFELAGGEACGVDVADLFHLEGGFEGDGVVVLAA